MKLRHRFKTVTIAGIYLADDGSNTPGVRLPFHTEADERPTPARFVANPGVTLFRKGVRRWDGPAIRRAEKRGRRAAARRLALREANA